MSDMIGSPDNPEKRNGKRGPVYRCVTYREGERREGGGGDTYEWVQWVHADASHTEGSDIAEAKLIQTQRVRMQSKDCQTRELLRP